MSDLRDRARRAVLRVAEGVIQQTVDTSWAVIEWGDGGKLIDALYGLVDQLHATYEGDELLTATASVVLDGFKCQVNGRGDVILARVGGTV